MVVLKAVHNTNNHLPLADVAGSSPSTDHEPSCSLPAVCLQESANTAFFGCDVGCYGTWLLRTQPYFCANGCYVIHNLD